MRRSKWKRSTVRRHYPEKPRSKKHDSFLEALTHNGGKLLITRTTRPWRVSQRDREQESCYFNTIKRGNYIKTFAIQYILDDTGLAGNLMMNTLLGNSFQVRVKLIVKTSIKDEELHLKLFKELSPTLDWY